MTVALLCTAGGRHFTELLTVDRAAVHASHSAALRHSLAASGLLAAGRPSAAAASDAEAGMREAVGREQHVSELERRRLLFILQSQAAARLPGGAAHLKGPGPPRGKSEGLARREVVSCTVINEGSPFAGTAQLYPSINQHSEPWLMLFID